MNAAVGAWFTMVTVTSWVVVAVASLLVVIVSLAWRVPAVL